MIKLKLDTETYSELDITKVGSFKYLAHKSTRPLCLSYKINEEDTQSWAMVFGEKAPGDLLDAAKECANGLGYAYAFNATFDLQVWNRLLVPNFRAPVIPLEQWRDVQAICGRYKLPQNLRQAAIALNCDVQKLATGKVLVKKCCTPEGKPTQKDFEDLVRYCKVDTDVLHEILTRLPADYLAPSEQKLWELTFKMNEKGLPIDKPTVEAIVYYMKEYMAARVEALPEITNGLVITPGQIQKIKQFCINNGVPVTSLAAEPLAELLERPDLPEAVREVLELRQELGLSSVSKYLTMLDMWNRGYVQGCQRYYGAGTGRWSGQGLQPHNFPRAHVENPEEWIEKFVNKEVIEKPVEIAKALLRPMIKAPEGYRLIVSDYSSIENRVLAWLAGDEKTLQGFRENFDQYRDMASYVYSVPTPEVTKEQRQLGKALVLGCGYNMGAKRFVGAAKTFGIALTEKEAMGYVMAYRNKYPLVVLLWRAYANMVKFAVQYPGKSYTVREVSAKVIADTNKNKWLMIKLPSGRTLAYLNPRLSNSEYGVSIVYESVDNLTFQWGTKTLTPGLITENVVQAAARDILCEGLLCLTEQMPAVQPILLVHDEIVTLINMDSITDNTMGEYNRCLCVDRAYRTVLPLKAEGYIAERYRKE
jgi:DNA polymerase